MPKFTINWSETNVYEAEVEADTVEEAIAFVDDRKVEDKDRKLVSGWYGEDAEAV